MWDAAVDGMKGKEGTRVARTGGGGDGDRIEPRWMLERKKDGDATISSARYDGVQGGAMRCDDGSRRRMKMAGRRWVDFD